jgi:hypothetical protein
MHQKFCKIGLTLGSFDFYLLLIDLHAYSEVFATEQILFCSERKGDEINKNLICRICAGNPTTNFLRIYL